MRTARCTLIGGPYCGEDWHFSVGARAVRITLPNCPMDAGEIYVRTNLKDSENRQIYQIRPRGLMRKPKQNHDPAGG